ncbi:hypothetical protein [Pseudomonas syringae]|uniref:hypothetical protein n=1 Tax=Pseudomonas syringae TaxID=317 RepID=UPI001F3799C4|nr:hypothetical protein [Pseudomonas syringae]
MALRLKAKEVVDTAAKWFDFDEDTKVLIAPVDSPEYQVAIERMQRRIWRNDAVFAEGSVGVLEGEVSEKRNHCMVLAKYIVKDWQGAQGHDGNALPYDEAIGVSMLESDLEFFLFVLRSAESFAKQVQEERKETLEKPLPASSGKASGQGRKPQSAS